MANVLEYSIDSINSDITEMVILDETTYSSPARSAVGNFVKVQKLNNDTSVYATLTVTGNDVDPETDTQYTSTMSRDGWYRLLGVSIPDFDTSDTYSIYEAVFNTSDNKVYRSKQNGNTEDTLTNTTWWEEITDPATLASNEGEDNESTNIDSIIFDFILTPASEKAFATVIANASEEYLTSLHLPDEDLNTYSLLGLLLDGTAVSSDRGNASRGERICRKLESLLEVIED